ncbi:Imm41 family immunity protein [Vibrio penaeicida]|uniref:Imm41 family immunity protein n=1 Tax=Vibrio penaeicida TaxID=104609 RepID=UPI000CEA4A57|nr:Imm41 family immunity protein [Vibrio penaeicida]
MSNHSVDEILKNVPGDGSPDWEHTFYGRLSEYGEWDVQKFWTLHRALIEVGVLVKESTSVDRNLVYALLYIQNGVLVHVSSHFDSRVSWKVESIDDEELQEYAERFQLAILGAISGDIIPESSFELVNPLLK